MRRLRDDHDNTPQGRRNRLVMALLIELGLRVSEVAALTVGDVNIAGNLIHVYRIKTDLDQWLEMTPTLRSVMIEWFNNDVDPDQNDDPLLRRTHKGGHLIRKGLTTRSINRIVGQQGQRHGIKNLSPHDLRHSWTDMNMDRVNDFERSKDTLRQAGGWKTSTMVDRYAREKTIANQGMGSALD